MSDIDCVDHVYGRNNIRRALRYRDSNGNFVFIEVDDVPELKRKADALGEIVVKWHEYQSMPEGRSEFPRIWMLNRLAEIIRRVEAEEGK